MERTFTTHTNKTQARLSLRAGLLTWDFAGVLRQTYNLSHFYRGAEKTHKRSLRHTRSRKKREEVSPFGQKEVFAANKMSPNKYTQDKPMLCI
tara:strand:- start:1678 stop:1956 length:279 start_codon:yes stop_codon:yes gene_type:complete